MVDYDDYVSFIFNACIKMIRSEICWGFYNDLIFLQIDLYIFDGCDLNLILFNVINLTFISYINSSICWLHVLMYQEKNIMFTFQ